MTTYEELSKDTRNWDHEEEEEDPRSYPQSPEPHLGGQDNLTHLLDSVLEAQDKYVQMFPDLKYRINEEQTKSFEDITFWMLNQGLFLFEQCKTLNSKLNGDYLSVLNKRLISENDQLKKVKEHSNQIIQSLNEDLAAQDEQIATLEAHLKIATQNLPSGDVESRAKKSRERDNSQNKKLQFELNMKDEVLNFREKSLKQANNEIKRIHNSLIEANDRIGLQEQKHESINAQLKAKNDLIRRLEAKIDAFKNTKSIAVKLDTFGGLEDVRKSVERAKNLESMYCFSFNLASPMHVKTLSRKEFESRTFWNGQNRSKKLFRRKSKKTEFEKLTGIPYDGIFAMMVCQAQDLEKTLNSKSKSTERTPENQNRTSRNAKLTPKTSA
jgi:uncharacterized coiled-coil protein SlyX